MIEATKYKTFEDGATLSPEEAFYTLCDICSEWLDYQPSIILDPQVDIFSVQFIAQSCGETFILEPTGYRLKKITKSELC